MVLIGLPPFGACVLRVPAIFRDFSGTEDDFNRPVYPDMTCGIVEGKPIVTGIAQSLLDADGRPQLGTAPKEACIKSAQSFARWFRDTAGTVKVVGNLVLFDNGNGGYVNRFGANGEKLTTTVAPAVGQGQEQQVPMATSQATCAPGCTTRVRSSLQCDNVCRPQHDAVRSSSDTLKQRQDQLLQLQGVTPPDDVAIATVQTEVDDLTATIATLTATADKCDTDCQTNFDTQVAACVADCKPCSTSPAQWCTGGKVVSYDGTPLFFPVDSVMGPT
ncbi:MAG: hypothetical protein ABJC63_13580, partial [Gemmatimonadales bacterium]